MLAIEPGLYRHGFGGVRLEDLVLVTEDGCEVLTDFPYDLDSASRLGPRTMSEQTIETLLLEERRYPPTPEFAAQANAQPGIYERELGGVLGREGRERVTWTTPFDRVSSGSCRTRSGSSAAR